MEPQGIYSDFIEAKVESMFGNAKSKIHFSGLPNDPIVQAFWLDNNTQEITIVSTSMGITSTYTKFYKQNEKS
jgi:hypothetical protein